MVDLAKKICARTKMGGWKRNGTISNSAVLTKLRNYFLVVNNIICELNLVISCSVKLAANNVVTCVGCGSNYPKFFFVSTWIWISLSFSTSEDFPRETSNNSKLYKSINLSSNNLIFITGMDSILVCKKGKKFFL